MNPAIDITPETKIGPLLDAYPHLEDVLLAQAPVFRKLKNPVLRKTVARVATLDTAARMAGLAPQDLVRTLRQAAGLVIDHGPTDTADVIAEDRAAPPAWATSGPVVATIDAEALLESGQTPLPVVLRQAAALAPGSQLRILSSFRPAPLIEALRSKGFQTCTQPAEPGRMETRVRRPGPH
jgi:hypothetical protein